MSENILNLWRRESDDDFRRALQARRDTVSSELDRMRKQWQSLEAQMREAQTELGHIDSLLGYPKTTAQEETASVRSRPADLVVELLRETGPLHYRDIERELRGRGWYMAEGSDPANTLLSKFFRDERLVRPARGVYAIRETGSPRRSVGTRRTSKSRTGRKSKRGRSDST